MKSTVRRLSRQAIIAGTQQAPEQIAQYRECSDHCWFSGALLEIPMSLGRSDRALIASFTVATRLL